MKRIVEELRKKNLEYYNKHIDSAGTGNPEFIVLGGEIYVKNSGKDTTKMVHSNIHPNHNIVTVTQERVLTFKIPSEIDVEQFCKARNLFDDWYKHPEVEDVTIDTKIKEVKVNA